MACTPGFIAAEGLWVPLPWGASTRRVGPPSSSLLTGTFRSCSVPVRRGGSTRLSGAPSLKGPGCREGGPYRPVF